MIGILCLRNLKRTGGTRRKRTLTEWYSLIKFVALSVILWWRGYRPPGRKKRTRGLSNRMPLYVGDKHVWLVIAAAGWWVHRARNFHKFQWAIVYCEGGHVCMFVLCLSQIFPSRENVRGWGGRIKRKPKTRWADKTRIRKSISV